MPFLVFTFYLNLPTDLHILGGYMILLRLFPVSHDTFSILNPLFPRIGFFSERVFTPRSRCIPAINPLSQCQYDTSLFKDDGASARFRPFTLAVGIIGAGGF